MIEYNGLEIPKLYYIPMATKDDCICFFNNGNISYYRCVYY